MSAAILNLPIEAVPRRYTIQWRQMFDNWFNNNTEPCSYLEVYPGNLNLPAVGSDEFLSPLGTNIFKAEQSVQTIQLISELHRINLPIVVFLQDLWHPVLTQLLYLKTVGGMDIRIVGCMHAGSYIEHDRLSEAVTKDWARSVEIGWLKGVDRIIVASAWHRSEIIEKLLIPYGKIAFTPWPVPFPVSLFDTAPRFPGSFGGRELRVVWPHRIAPEKNLKLANDAIEELCQAGLRIELSVPMQVHMDKEDYYRFLTEHHVALSTAREETFGIAMVEATMAGCIPLVPQDLCYADMYDHVFQYDMTNGAGDLKLAIVEIMAGRQDFRGAASQLAKQFARDYDAAQQTEAICQHVLELAS